MLKLTAVINSVPEGYIGYIEEVPGTNTQGDCLEEVLANLQEALSLVLKTNRELSERLLSGEKSIDDNSNLE